MNKVALVTAASRGIGYGIASNIWKLGGCVVICARSASPLHDAAKRIDATGERLLALAGDIGDPEFLRRLVSAAKERFGQTIDILVNNNGGPVAGPAVERTEEEWRYALDRNFMSVVRLCRLVVPGMREKKWGRIINLTSLSGKEPDPGMVLSSVTRAAVAAYGKTLSRELGPYGITVNTIMTGGVLTDRAMGFIREEIKATGETLDEAVERIGRTLPVQHIATPDEFAQTVLFLASESSAYVTGVALCLDGGASHSLF